MYYYKLCYGHQLDTNPKLNKLILDDPDIFDYSKEINNRTWRVDGKFNVRSCIFGTIISCSWENGRLNQNYCDDVRSAKESDYQEDYQLFLDWLSNELKTYPNWEDSTLEHSSGCSILVVKDQLTEFLLNNKPKFYMVLDED